MKRLRTLGLLLIGAITLASCTLIPTASSPKTSSRSLPFGLSSKTIPGTNHKTLTFGVKYLYFPKGNHLIANEVMVPKTTGFNYLFNQELAGPNAIESRHGMVSPLFDGVKIASVSVQDGIAYLNVTKNLLQLPLTQELLFEGAVTLAAYQAGATFGVIVTAGGTTKLLPLPDGSRNLLLSASDFTSYVLH